MDIALPQALQSVVVGGSTLWRVNPQHARAVQRPCLLMGMLLLAPPVLSTPTAPSLDPRRAPHALPTRGLRLAPAHALPTWGTMIWAAV